MNIPIKIRMVDERPPDVTIRAWREAAREAHAEQGEVYHREMVPRHFQPDAAARYGYRQRRTKTLERKQAAARKGQATEGGNTPLVLTGLLRRTLTELATIRAFPSRVTIQMNAPSYVPQRPRTNRQPPLADEATRVAPDEAQRLEQILHQSIIRRVDAYRAARATNIG